MTTSPRVGSTVRIGEVIQRREDAVRVEPDANYAMVGLLNRGRGLFVRGTISGTETNYSRLVPLRPGDLVFSKLFAWEGSVAVVDRSGWVSSEFPTYSIDAAQVDRTYLSHVIGWEGFVTQLAKATSGLGQRRQRVAPSSFESAEIPLPDLETQRAIAARLDAIASASDNLRNAASNRAPIDACAPRIISEQLAGLELPVVPLGDLYDSIGDVVQPEEDPGSAQRFVGLEHIVPHLGLARSEGGVLDRKGRKLRFRTDDVLYGYLRPYLNKVWVADGPGLCSVEQFVLRPRRRVQPRLLAHVLRSQATLAAVNLATHNLQLPRIRSGLLAEIVVPDIRHAPVGFADTLDAVNRRAAVGAQLSRRSNDLVASLLPAARNEEFRKLLAG